MFPTPDVGRDPLDKGYLLPEEPEGHPLRCVSFLIPDTIEYRAALYRQVYNLGVTETWDRTDAHKAMLAAEVWTGALQGSFTVFEDDCPVITQIRPDPSGCGNLEQSTDGGATWTDIPGTDFLPRNGLCAMTGGLEIYPTADEVLLTLKGVGSPYQTNKILRVQDSAGVDRAWINPRGDAHLNDDGTTRALVLETGSMFMNNNERINWKRVDGSSRPGIWAETDVIKFQSLGSGLHWRNNAGILLGSFSEGGTYVLRNATSGAGGITQMQIQSGAGQAANALLLVRNAAGDFLTAQYDGGRIDQMNVDTATGVSDNLTVEHRIAGTPAPGFGSGIRLRGKSSTTNAQEMARLYAAWETATHATRAAKVVLSAFDYSGEKTLIEGGVTGASTPKIGFLGITPQPRLAISGDHKGNAITEQIVEALALFGLITDATTNTDAFVLTGETGNWPLLQSFVDGLTNYSTYFVDTTSTGDCNLVCEPIPPEFWCKEYDFTNESDRSAWEIVRGLGNANGFESTMSDEMVFVHTSAFEPFRVIQVTIFYSQSGIADATILFGAYDFIGYIAHDWGAVDAGTGLDVQIDFSPSYESFSGFRIVATSTDPAQQIRITGLKVFGYDEGIFGIIPGGTDCP